MKRKLGEILIAAGAVTRADIEEALSDQSAGEPARLGDLLVSLGKISTLQLARALSQQYGVKFTSVPAVSREVLEAVPMELQRRFRFLPLSVAPASISIAMADLSHASSDVLPVLKKRWATVNLFVAPSDEIEAAHAQHEAATRGGTLPALASPAPRRPVVTATDDELFAALDLALPSDPPREAAEELEVLSGLEPLPPAEAPHERFELDVPDPPPAGRVAGRAEEEEPFFFEAAPAALLTTELGSPDAPAPSAEDFFGAPLLDEGVPVDLEVAITDPGLVARVAAPAPPVGEDQPFFETAPQAVPIATLEDEAFLPDVPMSSGSSLARLVIQPEPAPLTVVPPVDLPRPPPMASGARAGSFAGKAVPSSSGSGRTPIPAPEPFVPRASPSRALPEWLQASAPARPPAPAPAVEAPWTGALDDLAPSRLIAAVARALVRRGVLTEQDILDAAARKK